MESSYPLIYNNKCQIKEWNIAGHGQQHIAHCSFYGASSTLYPVICSVYSLNKYKHSIIPFQDLIHFLASEL